MGGRKGGKPDFTCMHLQTLLLWLLLGECACIACFWLIMTECTYIACPPLKSQPSEQTCPGVGQTALHQGHESPGHASGR